MGKTAQDVGQGDSKILRESPEEVKHTFTLGFTEAS